MKFSTLRCFETVSQNWSALDVSVSPVVAPMPYVEKASLEQHLDVISRRLQRQSFWKHLDVMTENILGSGRD